MFRRNRKPQDERDKLRPCEVDGDKAFFHRWAEGGIMKICAIVEYLDGTIHLAPPESVRFTDR